MATKKYNVKKLFKKFNVYSVSNNNYIYLLCDTMLLKAPKNSAIAKEIEKDIVAVDFNSEVAKITEQKCWDIVYRNEDVKFIDTPGKLMRTCIDTTYNGICNIVYVDDKNSYDYKLIQNTFVEILKDWNMRVSLSEKYQQPALFFNDDGIEVYVMPVRNTYFVKHEFEYLMKCGIE